MIKYIIIRVDIIVYSLFNFERTIRTVVFERTYRFSLYNIYIFNFIRNVEYAVKKQAYLEKELCSEDTLFERQKLLEEVKELR